MTPMIILGLSVVVQLAAVVLALRLIPLTGRRWAWILISAGLLLIVFRRALHIVQIARGADQPSPSEAVEATVNLVLSLLFLVGVHRIGAVFKASFKAREQLRASERKYRLLHETMTDAFVLVGMDGRIREFNKAYQDMLGYEADEIYRLTYTDITPLQWHEFEAEIVRTQILPRGHSDVYTKEYRRKDGKVFPVELRTFLLRDPAGTPEGMWAIVRDITERQAAVALIRKSREDLEARVQERTVELSQTVAALRESEQRYRQLFDTVPDAVWAFDVETGLCVDMNQAAERMFGYAASEARTVNVLDVSAEPERTKADLPRIAAEGRIVSIPLRQCRRKDGTVFPAEASIGTFEIAGRRVVCGVFRNITERLRAQAHLAESRDRLRSVLASMDDLLFVYDKEGRFIDYYCQPDKLDRLYAPPEQFLGRHYRDVLPAAVAGMLDGAIEALRQTGKVQQIEYAIDVAGRQVWSNAKVSLWRDAQGEVGGMTVVVRDVTERVLAERELRDSETRYRALFEQSPVALWEMDFSQLRPYVAALRAQGVQDLRQYFKENPDAENALIASTRAVAVNQAAARMHEAASKEELLAPSASYDPEYRGHMVEARLALVEGRRALHWSLAVILVGGLMSDHRNPRVSAGGGVADRGGQGRMEFRALRVGRGLGREVV